MEISDNNANSEFRFILLLAALFATVLIPPYFEGGVWFGLIWKVVFTGSLLAAMYAIAGRKKVLFPAALLFFPTVATLWGGQLNEDNLLIFYLDNLTTIAFLGFASFHLGRHVLASRQVTVNVIYGSLCLYLLIGFIWAAIYSNIHLYYGEAFRFSNAADLGIESGGRHMGYFTYYSFVTLSTLGYGDITPINKVAQAWSTVEAMVGQFYIAIVLARLVSLHATKPPEA